MKKLPDRLVGIVHRATRFVTHHLALKWRLMLMLSLLIVVFIGTLGYVSIRIYSDNIVSQTIARRHELGSSILEAIGIIRNRDDYSANQVVKNDDIMEALSYNGPQTPYLRFLEIRSCSKALMDIADKSNIVGVAVIGKDKVDENGFLTKKKSFFSKSETEETNLEAMEKLTDIPAVAMSKGESVWIPSKVDIFNAADKAPASLYVVKRLYSIRNANGQDVGLSVTQVRYSRLYDILSRVMTGSDEYAMLADGSGNILCATRDQSMVATPLPEGISQRISSSGQGSFSLKEEHNSVLYLFNRDSQSGWVLIQAIPYKLIAGAANDVKGWTLIVIALCLAGSLSLAWQFARTFTNPVVRLEKVMKRFGNGELTARSAADRSDEIGQLQQSFNSMAGQIKGLLEDMEEEHRQKRTMEMRMLEYQINPHFLYNSLDSINWMANSRGDREIAEMATALAKFFRIGLNRGRETISVADEVEHARNYLVISKIRYHDGFSFGVSVDPEVQECRTVKLIIQPLVENALVHAIKKTGDGGRVDIRAFLKDDKVYIEVEDNGRGIPGDRLEELRAMLARKTQGDGNEGGIGLMNVQQRIRLHFGAEYGLELESREGCGAISRIVIPKAH